MARRFNAIRAGLGAAAILALVSLSATSSAADLAPITTAGWGRVRVGMSRQAAARALGGDLRRPKGVLDATGCHSRTSARAPGLLFMVEGGRVVRVETKDPRYVTPSGVRVGDTEARARDAYVGRATVTPHKYSSTGHYLVIKTTDGRRAVVIETDEGKVVAVRGGQEPAVEYVEGCS
jgi:hypothetical protein